MTGPARNSLAAMVVLVAFVSACDTTPPSALILHSDDLARAFRAPGPFQVTPMRDGIALTGHRPGAESSGFTQGIHVALPADWETLGSGRRIQVRLTARSNGADEEPFRLAYSTAEVGNSGWLGATAHPDGGSYDFVYQVPPMRDGRGDFLGVLPDVDQDGIGIVVEQISFTFVDDGVPASPVAGADVMFSAPRRETRNVRPLGPECLPEGQRERPGQPKSYCGVLPSLAAVNVREARLETVIEGLRSPWAFEFLPDGAVLVTEMGGRLLLIDPDTDTRQIVTGLPPVSAGRAQRGLLDVALHPAFAVTPWVYWSYVVESEGAYTTALARGRLDDGQIHDVAVLLVAEPYSTLSSNFGGAIAFDDAGKLYLTLGDRAVKSWAQDPGVLAGKVVRLEADGRIPDDNPFLDSPGYHPAIYATGVRNPQGLVFDASRGLLFEAEHGPMGGDEVNIIQAGRDYGWPSVTFGMNYTYRPIGSGSLGRGFEAPLYYYLPSRAISPITVYEGDLFPEWAGDLIVGALRGRGLSRIDLVDDRVVSEQSIVDEIDGRVRDVQGAPDGSIWILVQEGRLHRLSRAERRPQVIAAGQRTGQQVFDQVCAGCHQYATPNVPQIGQPTDWAVVFARPRAAIYQNAIAGIGAMPARGFCDNCTDEEITRAVDYIINRTR